MFMAAWMCMLKQLNKQIKQNWYEKQTKYRNTVFSWCYKFCMVNRRIMSTVIKKNGMKKCIKKAEIFNRYLTSSAEK